MLKTRFQHRHQWPNAFEVRRDLPLTRDLFWCFFPSWKYPLGKPEAHNLPNQQTLGAGSPLAIAGINAMPGHSAYRQPFSVLYLNQYELPLGRNADFYGTQLPSGTNRSFTLASRLRGLGSGSYVSYGRNYYEAGGFPTVYLVGGGTTVTGGYGASVADHESLSVTAEHDVDLNMTTLVMSYSAAQRKLRLYANRRYTEAAYTKADFLDSGWLSTMNFGNINTVEWLMSWSRALEPQEVFSLTANPTQVLRPKQWNRYQGPPPPNVYMLDAEAGVFGMTGQDVSFLRGYALLADIGAFSMAGQSVTLEYTPPVPLPGLDFSSSDIEGGTA
jgi:hypothetical protein